MERPGRATTQELIQLYEGLLWALRQVPRQEHPAIAVRLAATEARLAELRREAQPAG